MEAQIILLLALTENLLDTVPLDQIKQAEKALYQAAENLPIALIKRFETASSLSEEDKARILELASGALAAMNNKVKLD
jgi:F-type H+/Na+-transporting ATPase subunit alpha